MTPPGFDDLLGRLAAAEAEFVIVGGLALGAWGVVRATKDVDIVISPDPENCRRVANVAVAANGHVQRGEALLGTPPSIAAAILEGEQVAIETDLGRLDIVQGLEGVPSFGDLKSRASEATVLGVTVWICSRDDLKAMKRAAGRTRDLADLEDLEAAGEDSGPAR